MRLITVFFLLIFVSSTIAFRAMAVTSRSLRLLGEAKEQLSSEQPGAVREAQKLLREALVADSTNFEAAFFLGESYYKNSGQIERAVEQLQRVKQQTESEFAESAGRVLEEIDHLFKPLRFKIKDKRIEVLSYIRNIRLSFRYPANLTETQTRRLRFLERERQSDEAQFTGVDPADGKIYFEIRYFPLAPKSRIAGGYAVVVNDKRRYRFDFTTEAHEPVEIFWELGWELAERVPSDLMKVEMPARYSFLPSEGKDYFVLERQDGRSKSLYVPAGIDATLVLKKDTEWRKELIYGILINLFVGGTTVAALAMAR